MQRSSDLLDFPRIFMQSHSPVGSTHSSKQEGTEDVNKNGRKKKLSELMLRIRNILLTNYRIIELIQNHFQWVVKNPCTYFLTMRVMKQTLHKDHSTRYYGTVPFWTITRSSWSNHVQHHIRDFTQIVTSHFHGLGIDSGTVRLPHKRSLFGNLECLSSLGPAKLCVYQTCFSKLTPHSKARQWFASWHWIWEKRRRKTG